MSRSSGARMRPVSVNVAPSSIERYTTSELFGPRIWLAGDVNFYKGGSTAVDGVQHRDLQKNSRVGSTFSWALTQHHSIRASISHGAYTTIGADFTSLAAGYNYAWTR